MNNRTTLNSLLALSCALATGVATAGPRVGSLVGTPNSTSSTIQARVISATPVVAQVAVPRQICRDEVYQEPARSSGAGALIGAIAGGVVGNALGRGAGNALATGVGLIGGAVLGDHIENNGRYGNTRSARRCEQQASYENQVVAYDVVYEYAGQRYSTQMNEEPGRTIPLQVTVNPLGSSAPVATASRGYTPEVEQATYYPPNYQPNYPSNTGTVIYGGTSQRGWDQGHGDRDRRWNDRGGWHRWD